MATPQTQADFDWLAAVMRKLTDEELAKVLYSPSMASAVMLRQYYLREPRTDDMVQMCDDLGIEPGFKVEGVPASDVYLRNTIPIPRRPAPAYTVEPVDLKFGLTVLHTCKGLELNGRN